MKRLLSFRLLPLLAIALQFSGVKVSAAEPTAIQVSNNSPPGSIEVAERISNTDILIAAGEGTAPSCIIRVVRHIPPRYIPCQTGRCLLPGTGIDIATVTNSCGKTMKVRVAWSWHRDSKCTRLSNGASKNFIGPYYRYQRTKTCS
jgi:hypothetical protein